MTKTIITSALALLLSTNLIANEGGDAAPKAEVTAEVKPAEGEMKKEDSTSSATSTDSKASEKKDGEAEPKKKKKKKHGKKHTDADKATAEANGASTEMKKDDATEMKKDSEASAS
jgi:hypothetical protein